MTQVITRRVTQVALIKTTGPDGEPWQVQWTEVRNRKTEQSHMRHFTEAAARRHVQGLLELRAAGLSVDSIYTERGL